VQGITAACSALWVSEKASWKSPKCSNTWVAYNQTTTALWQKVVGSYERLSFSTTSTTFLCHPTKPDDIRSSRPKSHTLTCSQIAGRLPGLQITLGIFWLFLLLEGECQCLDLKLANHSIIPTEDTTTYGVVCTSWHPCQRRQAF